MMTLYTAIGTYKLGNRGLPTIVSGNKEYGLVPCELLLWSDLAFRILTYKELKEKFYMHMMELDIPDEMEFDHCLHRLMMRGLVVSGKDCTGADALYNLLGHLHVQPVPDGWPEKVLSFMKLTLCKKMPWKKAIGVFHKEKLETEEKQILALVKNQTLSIAELIRCTEKGKISLKDNEELMECLYPEEDDDCEKLVTEGRFSEIRYTILSAVANLYMKQRIVFQLV
ncbi:MAG: cell division protein [Lachnospiraceae bacterium]|nr:cell division protein [Lachnospiraceae bacterium]MBO5354049.1 cell division protein [Lachnospiraceae bacterium]MBP3567904.1 cell division protein [Lachnospiraceae bacterium]